MSKRKPTFSTAYRLPHSADGVSPRVGINNDVADSDLVSLITALAREAARRDHEKAMADIGKVVGK
jgi:hypothetical protein